MSNIKWNSKLNVEAGFLEAKDPAVGYPAAAADAAKPKLSPTDAQTLLNLIWTLTYTEQGRKVLKENRPKKAHNGVVVTEDQVRTNLTKWIKDFGIHDSTVVQAVVEAHIAADAWIAEKLVDGVDQAKYEKIYQQNVAVVTWMLWEDAMGHEFSMNW